MSALEDRLRQCMSLWVLLKEEMDGADLQLQVDVETITGERRFVMSEGVDGLPVALGVARLMEPTLVAVMADAYTRLHHDADELRTYQRGEMQRVYGRDPEVVECLVVTVMDTISFEFGSAFVRYGREDDGSLRFEDVNIDLGATPDGRIVEMMRGAFA